MAIWIQSKRRPNEVNKIKQIISKIGVLFAQNKRNQMSTESNQSTPWIEITIQKSKMKRLTFQNRILYRESEHNNEIPYKQLFTMQVEITRSSFKNKKDVSASVPESSNHLVNNAQCYDTQDRFPRVFKPLRVSIIIQDKT